MRTVVTQVPAKEALLPGNAKVLRALPRREKRRVGPFVFVDHAGPSPVSGAHAFIGAHPHVGLATVSYLLSGEAEHQDSTGAVQRIRPGDVNWMTSGRGIVHAEKLLGSGPLELLQTWVALPHAHRDVPPRFDSFPADVLPVYDTDGTNVRVIAGALDRGNFSSPPLRSPVPLLHPTLYLDVALSAGRTLPIEVDPAFELALYLTSGTVDVAGNRVEPRTLALLSDHDDLLEFTADTDARVFVFGGAPMPDPTVTWWNFVVASVEEGRRLEEDWKSRRFPDADWQPAW